MSHLKEKMKMKKINNLFLISYLISFIIVWLCYIFWLEKDEFDLEFRDKKTTTAIIFNLGTNEVIDEMYDGRKTNVYDIKYIEYSYFVNGKKYKYGSEYYDNDYSVSDKIQIEYVKSNPSVSKVKGLKNYSFNYFVRNLIMVSIFSLFLMFGILITIESLLKSKLFNNIINKFRKQKLSDLEF